MICRDFKQITYRLWREYSEQDFYAYDTYWGATFSDWITYALV